MRFAQTRALTVILRLAQTRALVVIPGRVRHRLIVFLAASSLVLAVAGCHVPGTSSPSALPPGQNLTVAVVPGIDTVPLAVAVKNGLFSQQGIGKIDDIVAGFDVPVFMAIEPFPVVVFR